MRHWRAVVLACIALVLLLAVACSTDAPGSDRASPTPDALASSIAQYRAQFTGPDTVTKICDWVARYDSITGLANDADIIITADVTASSQKTRSTGGVAIVGTTDHLAVGRVFKGSVEHDQDISLFQAGGIRPDGNADVCLGDPLLAKGITYLLFLHRTSNGEYDVLGGSDGRFVVQDGKIEALSVAYQDSNFDDTGISGLTLDQVAEQVG